MRKFYQVQSEQAFIDVRDIKCDVKNIEDIFQNPNILDSEEVVILFTKIDRVIAEMSRFKDNLTKYLKDNVISEEDAEVIRELWYKRYNQPKPKPKYFSDNTDLTNYDDDLPF